MRYAAVTMALVALVAALTPAPASAITGAPACPLLPADNVWHADVSSLPVNAKSDQYVASMGLTSPLHPDFGSGTWDGGPIGIPFVTVPGNQPKVAVSFTYGAQSDKGPYPIPANPPIEGGPASHGDRHVLMVDRDNCVLYELFAAYPKTDGTWRAGSGAIYDLNSDALRKATWTSADAAGLPILPGLVTYDEAASGYIDHAIRVTADQTQNTFIWPARHQAGDPGVNLPPMGLRLRLKADVDISKYSAIDRTILQALKTYGMIVADNGTSWFISGAPDPRWNNDDLHLLTKLDGSDFEAVDESSLMVNVNSGQAKDTSTLPTVSIADASRREPDSGTVGMRFTLTLSKPAATDVTVVASTVDYTATAPSDYLAKRVRVTIPAGTTTGAVVVKIVGDVVAEPNEAFAVRLSSPVGATIGRGEAVGTIINDD
jgi:hypothetical protein